MVVVKSRNVWATMVLVVGRVCSVEGSVKTEGRGITKVGLIVTVLMASVDKDSRFGGSDSITIL